MTEPEEFETNVRRGMQRATRGVVAPEDLQRRLIATASAASVGVNSAHYRRFPAAWALPAAAAVITLGCAGSVWALRGLASGPDTVPGNGIPGTVSSTPPAPSIAPTLTVTAPTPTSSPVRPSKSKTSRHPATRSSTATSSSPAPSTSSSVPTSSSSPSPAFPAACSVPAHGSYDPQTEQAFVDHVVGTWAVCSHPSIFGTDDAGLQIKADHQWTKLTRNPNGHLVPASGWHAAGTWDVVDVSGMNGRPTFQINLKIDGGGTLIIIPEFSANAQRMHMDNNGVYEADYVPA